jgi:hypothetical protein
VRRVLLLASSLLLVLAVTAQAAPVELTPRVEGPDQEPSTQAAAVVSIHERSMFSFSIKPAALKRTVTRQLPKAPPGGWDRVMLQFLDEPTEDEPWDRVFSVAVGNVELLRGTTPRTAMKVRKDVTEYLSLLGPGRRTFTTEVATYTGGHQVSVRLEFYKGESTRFARHRAVVGGLRAVGIEPDHADATRRTAKGRVTVPRGITSAELEVTTSGHLQGGEFWYLPPDGSVTPPVLHVLLDGQEVATAHAMPYVYALAGLEGGNKTVHPVLWWTAQQYLDKAGVHTGVGEIPPYRVSLPADVVSRLRGTHRVQVSVEGRGLWITSLSLLLD